MNRLGDIICDAENDRPDDSDSQDSQQLARKDHSGAHRMLLNIMSIMFKGSGTHCLHVGVALLILGQGTSTVIGQERHSNSFLIG